MKIIKKKNQFPNTMFVGLSVLCSVPNMGTTNQPRTTAIIDSSFPTDYDFMAYNLADQAHRGNVLDILQELKIVADMLEESDDPITDSCAFLRNFINRMNNQFGTSVTLAEVLHTTRELIYHLPISNSEAEYYFLGVNLGVELIDSNKSEYASCEQLGSFRLARHHKRSNVWTWLSIATVTVGAVAVCIFCPEAAIPVINGAVEIGKTIINNK